MIKPPLYLFDPDQTHDLLWAEKIDSRISSLISNAHLNHGLFDGGSLPIALIDRYIPGGDHLPWASEWSTTYFEFLKPLSRTHLLTNSEINGSAYGFEPEYQADLPEELNLGATFPDKVKVKFFKGTTGSVTWLERAHSETRSGQYCPQVSNRIQVWSRRGRVVTAPKDKDVVIELDSRLWLHNSVVFQNASFEGLPDAQKKLLDYAELDDRLENIYSQLRIGECRVLTGLGITLNSQYSSFSGGDRNFTHTLSYSAPTFETVPARYFFASLLYANLPTEWTSENPRLDKGQQPILIYTTSKTDAFGSIALSLTFATDPFRTWLNTLNGSPWGYNTDEAGKSTALTFPLLNNHTGNGVAEYRTYNGANHSKLTSWLSILSTDVVRPTLAELRTFNVPGYESVFVIETNTYYRRSSQIPKPEALNGLDVIPSLTIDRWWYKTEHSTTYPPLHTTQIRTIIQGLNVGNTFPTNRSQFFYPKLEFSGDTGNTNPERRPGRRAGVSSAESALYIDQSDPDYWYIPDHTPVNDTTVKNYIFNPAFISVLFPCDSALYLFDRSQTALFRHDLEYNETTRVYRRKHDASSYVDTWYTGDPEFGQSANSYSEHKVFKVIGNTAFTVTYPNDITSNSITIQNNNGMQENQQIYTYSARIPAGETSAPFGTPVSGEIISTQTLNRRIRQQSPNVSKFIIVQWNDVTDKYDINPNVTEENFLKLIEPTEGVFICDPNPDPLQNRNTDPAPNDPNNTEWIGDIMPDSIRIKEIHAALQAEKYANDDKDATKARVTNLGWLIDKMSNVLGLHFASDGKMLKVRNTEHKKDGDTIPEQWQIGQWGKNNWVAEDGTVVNGVGYAYEVRSNGFATDKFTGAATAIEEGGWVLCNSLIQLLEVKYDDDDRAFGLQDMGANVIPKSDRLGYLKYEGMHGLLVEIAYMLSSMSGNITRSEVLDMKSVAMLQELIGVMGTPVTLKTMPAKVAGLDVNIPYSGFEDNSPSLVDFSFWILANLAPLVASNLSLKLEEEEEENA